MKKTGETTYKETSFGIIPRSQLIELEIEGIKRAWDFVVKSSQENKLSFSSRYIKNVHKVGFSWIFPDFGGRFRDVDVKVSHHVPPKHFKIEEEMKNFFEDLKVRIKNLPSINEDKFLESLVEVLAWSHHKFLWIHPFKDYNGRLARLLNNIILLKLELPPIELAVETAAGRKKYIQALQDADNGNSKKLEKLVKDSLLETLREIETST